jgi:hypothetical protein
MLPNIPAKPKNNAYQMANYEITEEPLVDKAFQSLPRAVQQELNTIFINVQDPYYKDKSSLVARLEELVQQYPHVPHIANYLAAGYHMTRNKKAKIAVEENYKNHPNYLFSRIDYARLCLERRDLEKVKEIFKEGFDLKLMYPQRNRFHMSEFVAFNFIICIYYRLSGDMESAMLITQTLEKVAPEHPVTKQVQRMTDNSLLNRLRNSWYKFKRQRREKKATLENQSLQIQS